MSLAFPDLSVIKSYARGRWSQIIPAISSLNADLLDSSKHPCPKCGGTDRFRAYDDFNQEGGVVCSQCHPASKTTVDGFATIQWANGWNFPDTVRAVAEYLNLSPATRNIDKQSKRPGHIDTLSIIPKAAEEKPPKPPADSQLIFKPWNDALVALWCMKRPPILPEALKRFGARIAQYKSKFTVLAIPIFPCSLEQCEPVGWIVYNITGGTLPSKDGPVGKRLTFGSSSGIVGMVDKIGDKSLRKIKTEGPTDGLALLSLDTNTQDVIFCNACGARERPDKEEFKELPSLVAGSRVVTIGDADNDGILGAEKWANFFAQSAADSRIARLPFEVVPSHGKDLRNWTAEGSTQEDFEALIGEPVKYQPPEARRALESPDDPHKLARANIEAYREEHSGELRYWRGQWLKWKGNRYWFMTDKDIEAKVNQRIKSEFDKQWELDYAKHIELKATDPDYDKEPPNARRVTTTIVRDTLAALRSLCSISSSIEMGTWVQSRERKKYLACKNCIIDIAAFIEDAPADQVFLDHSPNWFSTSCLAYEFDPSAACPLWLEYIYQVTAGDEDKISLLQEFVGYILSPDNTRSKFLVLEGDGGHGKSVFCNGIEAIIGSANKSSVGLDVIGKRFQSLPTLGKMLNICQEANDIDAPAESFLKNFTGGNPVMFEGKGSNAFEALPTAKIVITWNTSPRFKDRSEGLWRRMLVVKFDVKPTRPNPKMLEPDFWLKHGQLPGMLNWALLGLKRLEERGDFSVSEESRQAIEAIRTANNSARMFIREHYQHRQGARLLCKEVYEAYSKWCSESGMCPVNSVHFGREISQVFKGNVTRERKSLPMVGRAWVYENLENGDEEGEGF